MFISTELPALIARQVVKFWLHIGVYISQKILQIKNLCWARVHNKWPESSRRSSWSNCYEHLYAYKSIQFDPLTHWSPMMLTESLSFFSSFRSAFDSWDGKGNARISVAYSSIVRRSFVSPRRTPGKFSGNAALVSCWSAVLHLCGLHESGAGLRCFHYTFTFLLVVFLIMLCIFFSPIYFLFFLYELGLICCNLCAKIS